MKFTETALYQKISQNKLYQKYEPTIKKFINQETISFVFFGLLTSALNIALFYILTKVGMHYQLANAITLVVTKLAAYVCNKFWVFHSKTETFAAFISEFGRYFVSRLFTFFVDYFGLIFLVEVCQFPKFISKCAVAVLVVLINYILGKKAVFRKK